VNTSYNHSFKKRLKTALTQKEDIIYYHLKICLFTIKMSYDG